jgi:hypothetical protein
VDFGEKENPLKTGDHTEDFKIDEGEKVLVEVLDFGQDDETVDYKSYLDDRTSVAYEAIESENIPNTLKDAVDEYFKEISY